MLPIKTTAEDVIGLVEYLRTKPTGATAQEAKAAVNARLLDTRKLGAYEAWGFVAREGDRLKLSERGRKFARVEEPGRQQLFRDVVADTKPYRLAIEWMYHQKLDSVSNLDVAAHWHEHIRSELGSDNENTIREQVNAFFNVAEAAGLGRYVLGRGGQPTRLEPFRDGLREFVAEAGLRSEVTEITAPASAEEAERESPGKGAAKAPTAAAPSPSTDGGTDRIRVFISHGRNIEIVGQVKTMLDLADVPYEIAVEEETAAIPVPEKVLAAMRRCTAAVICVTADPDSKRGDGSYSINENVLIEIGSAFVLYEKRVALVWDRRIPVPSNLQGLYRCEFEGSELSWGAGMKLMQAIVQMKRAD